MNIASYEKFLGEEYLNLCHKTMMHEHGAEWTNPCKNLTNTDEYCEL